MSGKHKIGFSIIVVVVMSVWLASTALAAGQANTYPPGAAGQASVAPASSDANDNEYVQTPGHFGGFFSDGQSLTVADEFQLVQGALIQKITWWGGYGGTTPPQKDHFTIRLFTDNGGTPGALVKTLSVDNNPHRKATGDFVNPPNGDFEGRPEFQYSFQLPEPFRAEANTRYWLSIVNVPSSDSWVWEVSDSLMNLGVQRSFNDPVLGPWDPYFDNTAFQLQSKKSKSDKDK